MRCCRFIYWFLACLKCCCSVLGLFCWTCFVYCLRACQLLGTRKQFIVSYHDTWFPGPTRVLNQNGIFLRDCHTVFCILLSKLAVWHKIHDIISLWSAGDSELVTGCDMTDNMSALWSTCRLTLVKSFCLFFYGPEFPSVLWHRWLKANLARKIPVPLIPKGSLPERVCSRTSGEGQVGGSGWPSFSQKTAVKSGVVGVELVLILTVRYGQ